MQCLVLLAALLGLTSAATFDARQNSACNNSPDLCTKSYSAITHLGAHNSPFLRDTSTRFSSWGNHYFNTTVQLGAGVRMLTGQVHQSNGEWHLCHSSCDLLDAGTLSEWLSEIKAWMDENPSDVVSLLLVNSDDAKPAELAAEFEQSGILKYKYAPPAPTLPPKTWPTLQELITDDTRLLSFVGSLKTDLIDDSNSYLMNEFSFIFETKFENQKAEDFSCVADRPESVKGKTEEAISSGRMPLQNHFLYDTQVFDIQAPAEDTVADTNAAVEKPGNMGEAAEACQTEWGKPPVFIMVDFFDEGPAIATVDKLNGVANPVGRTPLPPRDVKTQGTEVSGALPETLVEMVERVKEGENVSIGAWIWAGADYSKTFGGWDPTGRDQ